MSRARHSDKDKGDELLLAIANAVREFEQTAEALHDLIIRAYRGDREAAEDLMVLVHQDGTKMAPKWDFGCGGDNDRLGCR